jgi:hypothetical protein
MALAHASIIAIDPGALDGQSRLCRVGQGGGASVLANNKPPGAVYTAVAAEPSGTVIVASDPNGGTQELWRFDSLSGAMTPVAKGGKLVYTLGVTIDADREILVADRRNGVVRVNAATGAQSIVSTGGSFVTPTGIAVWR